MQINYSEWIPFDSIYTYDENATSRGSIFKPKNEMVTNKVAGIYLIADSSIAPLTSPESLINIGKTVGNKKSTTFHDRLWKHCCKAIGECGGSFSERNGNFYKDNADTSEPKDTENWASYRHNQFKNFSTWYFSFYCLEENDFELAKEKIGQIQDITMYAFSHYSNPCKPLCNSQSPKLTVKFPWA
jgi:hypothetical protein